MMNKDYSAELRSLADLARKLKYFHGPDRQVLVKEYQRQLNELILNGWSYALGKENEIEESLLPHRYLNQRSRVIDDLQIQLGNCAERYRGAPSGSADDRKAIAEYHETFSELLRITGEIIGLDPDSELPDEEMPQEYVDFWLR